VNWDRIAEEYLTVAYEVLSDLRPRIEATAADLAVRLQSGHKIMFCGNGGSAAAAQHFAAELVNRFLLNRRPYAGLALSTDTSSLTAIANDVSFDDVFAKQVLALGRPGDALVGFSTSGNSRNLGAAFAAAQSVEIRTVALVGGDGGELAKQADTVLCISASRHTPRIQEGHDLMMHLLCERIEERMTESELPED
jgi:D-sedoheptulose 7-phosphate isomerase